MAQNINTQTLKIDGMTCINCQNAIEKKLKSLNGIKSAKVSYSSGVATFSFDGNIISIEKIIKAIEQLGYKIVQKQNKKFDFSRVLGVGFIILALYLVIDHFGFLNYFGDIPLAEEGMGYGMLFVIGLLTSIHCVAMCGGINLSQCVPQKALENKNGNKVSTLRPSLLYNMGRVISYTVVGGIVGAIGSVFTFSGTARGFVQIAAGIFMIIMGINMLNIFPWLRKFSPRMPKIFANKINEQKQNKGPLYVGLLNGLMPCGPLQAMQIYALSTGSPVKGAVSMFLFSLGTVPLMFGLGALSSLLSKKFTSKMMTVSAALVVVLGIFMFNSGAILSGFTAPRIGIDNDTSEVESTISETVESVDGFQVIKTKLSSRAYEPITVKKGIPVKWIISAQAKDINSCNNEIIVPEYDIEKKLKAGDNIIEFTPTESGVFPFSCWMGMIGSEITVTD
ncbi:MAG TPA: heavy metal transporter [Clostridiales bacterium]|nr:heavy metal transporter [Clostridiales bacterium]